MNQYSNYRPFYLTNNNNNKNSNSNNNNKKIQYLLNIIETYKHNIQQLTNENNKLQETLKNIQPPNSVINAKALSSRNTTIAQKIHKKSFSKLKTFLALEKCDIPDFSTDDEEDE